MIEFMVVSTVLLWFGFALIFPLAKWAQTKPDWVQQLVYPLAAAFYLSDVLFNAVVGSLFFLELPEERTFSERIERLRRYPRRPLPGRWYGWRYELAGFFERIILKIDPEHFS